MNLKDNAFLAVALCITAIALLILSYLHGAPYVR